MRRQRRASVVFGTGRSATGIAWAAAGWLALSSLLMTACAPEGRGGANAIAEKSPAVDRATRRAYDGAPPVVAHENFAMTCVECHNLEGREVAGVGFAPPSPHEQTAGLSALSNCTQCHVMRRTEETFRASRFVGLPQDLRAGRRRAAGAPPVMPHPVFMRENCQACHTGPAAREEIRTSHPERTRCAQCHIEQRTAEEFSTGG